MAAAALGGGNARENNAIPGKNTDKAYIVVTGNTLEELENNVSALLDIDTPNEKWQCTGGIHIVNATEGFIFNQSLVNIRKKTLLRSKLYMAKKAVTERKPSPVSSEWNELVSLVAHAPSESVPSRIDAMKQADLLKSGRPVAFGTMAWIAFVKHVKERYPERFEGLTKEAEKLALIKEIREENPAYYTEFVEAFKQRGSGRKTRRTKK